MACGSCKTCVARCSNRPVSCGHAPSQRPSPMISQKLSEPLHNLPMKPEPALADLHRIPDATLLDAATGQPAPGVFLQAVAAAATGVSVGTLLQCSTSLCNTDSNGQVSFSYSSTSPGDQVITVWVDGNINGLIDPGEPQVRAAVTWTRAHSTTWLALGDSYSAGVGIPGAPGDPDNPNCRQHQDLSYAGQARTTEASEHTIAFKFAACNGAVT